MEAIFDPSVLAGLATLIVLEVVLGIDNLVFIAILTDKLPPHQRDKARILGLSLALIMRLGLLASIAWIVGLTDPVFTLFDQGFSWRDIILAGGGLFLLIKATKEIHERLEGDAAHGGGSGVHAAFGVVIAQIIAIDAVFSLDSIITAVGMVDELWVMMVAVIVAMVIMLIASKPLTVFVSRHPTVIILCLSFLLLIGCSLIAEGFGFHIPKAYLYVAIGFSLLIEVFNQTSSRNKRKSDMGMPLRQRAVDGIYRLLTPTTAQQAHDAASSSTSYRSDEISAQAFQPSEQAMIRGVLELAEHPVRAIMTPRSDIFWVDAKADAGVNRDRLIDSGRTRVLVCQGSLDQVIGLVETREVLPALLRDHEVNYAALAKRPLVVPDELPVLRLIDLLRDTGERFALVVDSHGNIDGVVTTTDIFAVIAGDIAEDENGGRVERLDAHTVEVDATMTLDALANLLRIAPLRTTARYTTIAGSLLFELGRMPEVGETLRNNGLEFTVLETSSSRIERVRVAAVVEGSGSSNQ